MSRIDDLIAEHCPDGVDYIPISELFDLRNGYTPRTTDESFWTDGTIPWFRMEDIRANGRILRDSIQKITESATKGGKLFPANSLLIATSATIGEHALITVPHLSNQRFTSLALKPNWSNQLDMKFAFYYGFVLSDWCQNNTTQSSFASVEMAGFRKFRFPVPPIEVQREIVRILDTFTQLEAELEAELEARRIQYAHYRDSLLTFGPDMAWATVGQVADVTKLAGYEFTSHVTYVDDGEIIALRGLNVNSGRLVLDQLKFIDGSNLAKLSRSKLFVGDMLFTYVGTIGQVALIDRNDRYYLAPNVSRIRFQSDVIHPQFMLHYFRTDTFVKNQIGALLNTSSLKNLTMANIRKFRIPVPSLDVQSMIVERLDQFEALTSDLSIGLPAELEARRKQYAYYRDKLLTFPEKV